METETHIWDALPDDLLCSILARLPVRDVARMRIVCKRWKNLLPPGDALQRIDPNFSVNSIPAFLIQLYWNRQYQEVWVIELAHGGGSDINIYRSPSPINDLIIVDACQSICLCMRHGDRLNLSLFNPATRTWRQLPRPADFNPYWHFNALTFDATLRRCTILLGQISTGDGDVMVLQIYDSESNAWTRVSMKVPFFIHPRGKGFCSNRKFYWIVAWRAIYFVAALDIAESSWTQITLPEVCTSITPSRPAFLYLGGSDGQVVLIRGEEKRGGSIRMWRLNDVRDAAEWHELHDIRIPEWQKIHLVAINSEWIMMVNSERDVYLFNLEQKSTQKVSLPGRLRRDLEFFQWFLSTFESNNVWWP